MKYYVFDAHCDTLSYLLDSGEKFQVNNGMLDRFRLNRYKRYTPAFACFISPKYRSCALERCLKMISMFHNDYYPGILSIEGGEMITSPEILRTLHLLKVKMIGLTWNHSNHLAGGADDENPLSGLTEFGETIVNEMNKLNIYADVSHLNDRSFYDVAQISKKPLIASHSNSRTVCNHRRNLTDDMFEIIKKSGGCVGINFYPPFLNESGNADIDDIIRHIEHFMELDGEDYIGIGADFDGTDGLMPEGICGCQDTYKVFDRLLQLNYTYRQVAKISHRNFERLFKPERKYNAQIFCT